MQPDAEKVHGGRPHHRLSPDRWTTIAPHAVRHSFRIFKEVIIPHGMNPTTVVAFPHQQRRSFVCPEVPQSSSIRCGDTVQFLVVFFVFFVVVLHTWDRTDLSSNPGVVRQSRKSLGTVGGVGGVKIVKALHPSVDGRKQIFRTFIAAVASVDVMIRRFTWMHYYTVHHFFKTAWTQNRLKFASQTLLASGRCY